MSDQYKFENETDEEVEIDEPNRYSVLLLNDDFTSMEFVVYILESIFKKSNAEAEKLMYLIHNEGRAVCGTYSHEIAETKVFQVKSLAKQNSFPLRAVMEEE